MRTQDFTIDAISVDVQPNGDGIRVELIGADTGDVISSIEPEDYIDYHGIKSVLDEIDEDDIRNYLRDD